MIRNSIGSFRASGPRNSVGAYSLAVLTVVVLSAAFLAPTKAATIALDLTCPLNGLNSSSCSGGPSFGTITLEDLTGVDAGKVKVTVDLGFTGTQKFADLMLNYAGSATSITDNDSGNTVVLNSNAYSISPYDGDFDLGGTGGQGWHNGPTSGSYSTVLSGNSPLSTSDFIVLDTGNKLYAAMHIQNIGSASGGSCDGSGSPAPCAPGVNGPGSLKIGAPNIRIIPFNVPEPSSFCLIGLAATLYVSRLRKRSVVQA
jgi:hypothetical protein